MAKLIPGILLVNPCTITENYISLAYIAAYVKSHGFRADVIDFAIDRPSPLSIQNVCLKQQPILIGIAAYQSTMHKVISAVKMFKKISSAKIILGGPQIPGMPNEGLRQLEDVDFLCRGEGEITTLTLLKGLYKRVKYEDIPGISYKLSDGSVKTNPNPKVPKNLDIYPSPYLQDIINIKPGSLANLLSSRGCPHACKFCITPFLSNRRLRFHSIERVISEILYLNKKGVSRFWFADPTFSSNKARTIRLLNRIIESKVKADIWCDTRTDMVDDNLLSLMKRAGVTKIAYGLETTNEDILKRTDKKLDIGKFQVIIEKTKKYGIEVEILHMIGFPGETFESIISTFNYIRKLGCYFRGNTIGNFYHLYFGSEDCRNPKKAGFIIPQEISYPSYLSPGTIFRSQKLSKIDFKKIYLRREREIFLAHSRSQYRKYHKTWGISVKEAFCLPWNLVKILQDIFSVKDSPELNEDKPIDRFFVLAHDSKNAIPICCLGVLKNTLNNLSYDFQLLLFSDDYFLLGEKDIANRLFDMLSSSFLYDATIVFSFKADSWQKKEKMIIRTVRRFTRYRLPSPIYNVHSNPDESIKQRIRSLCTFICLVDVTSYKSITPTYFNNIYQTLNSVGVTVLPFFNFKDKDSISIFLKRIKSLGIENMPEKNVMVGLANGSTLKGLNKLYGKNETLIRLPILQIVNGGILYPGSKKFSKLKRKVNSLYINSQGITSRSFNNYFNM